MSAVDVLAVMDRVFAATGPADIEVALWDLPEARAAVAELIGAAADMRKGCKNAKWDRLDAALARVQGGAS